MLRECRAHPVDRGQPAGRQFPDVVRSFILNVDAARRAAKASHCGRTRVQRRKCLLCQGARASRPHFRQLGRVRNLAPTRLPVTASCLAAPPGGSAGSTPSEEGSCNANRYTNTVLFAHRLPTICFLSKLAQPVGSRLPKPISRRFGRCTLCEGACACDWRKRGR